MSHTIQVDAARYTQRSQGRSRAYRRAVLAVGTPLLMMTAGCTAQPPEQSAAESVPATVDALPQLADLPANGEVPPGRYVISPYDTPVSDSLAPVMAIPQGYSNLGGGGVTPGYLEEGAAGAVWLWNIRSVYTHPCDAGGYPELVGPSVADLAGALATQPMRDGTEPAPVTIGGYDGLYVELTTPTDLDFTTCREGYFHSWPGRSQRDAGQVDLLWIVDVDGQRITFDVSYPPSATPEQVEELTEMVTTATFTRRDGA